MQERLPVLKQAIAGDGVQVGEEGFAGSHGLAGLLPGGFQAVQDGVEGEGQQVQRGEVGGQEVGGATLLDVAAERW